ncbi:HTH domain-containing protein [Cohnella sp. AR92]|uniref:HTH domain-containing protein n=1 Tax=Cohnella sp. AR92 TaxID=648716 RepID=UPI000F8D4663|nr:HTH domain-containing protein [Cohnella sp. AR92]RUS46515.1 HTH domain-containing protein [Cohnella sp. AR92]
MGTETRRGQEKRVVEQRVDSTQIKFDAAFQREYAQMMADAIKRSRGERKRRLQEEHSHAEKLLAYIWWQAVGNLKNLHPEFEIVDLRGTPRYPDYAFLPSPGFRLVLEVDGFGPHWRDISRWRFDDNDERQNLLLIDEWKLLRFSYDGLNEKTARCKQTILMALARWGRPIDGEQVKLNVYERAVMHYSRSIGGEKFTTSQIARALDVTRKTIAPHLNSLVEKSLLTAIISKKGLRTGYKERRTSTYC